MSGPPAKKTKTALVDTSTIEKQILEYMRAQNRPYSLINIFDNMHAPFPKAQMQAALERLVAEGSLVVKEYGAQKFFFCPQDSFGDCSSAATADLERAIAEMKTELADLNAKAACFLSDCPSSDEQLKAARAAAQGAKISLVHEINVIQQRIDEYAKRKDAIGEFDVAIEKFGRVLVECQKRKKIFKNILGFLAEQLNVTSAALIEELGLDISACCVL